MTFLNTTEALQARLKQLGIVTPTAVQEKTIPIIRKGKDLITQAQTGTGKTLAFVLPILEKVKTEEPDIQALIVTPTRELALQVTNVIESMKEDDVSVLAVYGGQDVEKQAKKLKGHMHIVVATPGRLLDQLKRGNLTLDHVHYVVLDEADQMLETGFLPDVVHILDQVPDTRQTLLFSATITDQIQALAQEFLQKPTRVTVEKEQVPLANIKQLLYETTDRAKLDTLKTIMKEHRPFLAMIFCRTKRRVRKLNDQLKAAGFEVDELHGDLSQSKREKVLERFREAKIQYLVATDVAARGIDVEGVTHVFNYDIPQDPESYVHRIGRTGRAGGTGLAITFASPGDKQALNQIEKKLKLSLKRRTLEGLAPGKRSEH